MILVGNPEVKKTPDPGSGSDTLVSQIFVIPVGRPRRTDARRTHRCKTGHYILFTGDRGVGIVRFSVADPESLSWILIFIHSGSRPNSVADPEPGSRAFLTPGSGIRNKLFLDPGSQPHIF
jgi:hypothetical protein